MALQGHPPPDVRQNPRDCKGTRLRSSTRPMSTLPPLSHHEILQRVAPFSRRGIALDLAASDRAARRMAFRWVQHEPGPTHAGEIPERVTERLELDLSEAQRCRLVRTLEAPDGLEARLEVEAPDPETALERLATVPLGRQFRRAGDLWIALHQRLASPTRGAEPLLGLRGARARLAGGLQVEARLSSVAGYPVEIELIRPAPGALALPDDVLAVLGGAWERLVPTARGWRGAAGVRGAEPARSAAAEERLVEAVRHLDQTLSAPPSAFHERHRGARWRVALRGMPPLLVGAALVVAAVAIQRWWPERASWIGLLANMAPPVLMALFFMRREMPRIGLPRVPRCPPPTAWPGAESAPAGVSR
jgi:hypothetical protein